MKIIVISASMRANSQSQKVAKWFVRCIERIGAKPDIVDLHELALPFYDDTEQDLPAAKQLNDKLETASAFVFVSPEWNGSMSTGLINMMHFVENEMAHKPVMLVGVSSGRGGTHPVDQMRLIGHKNRHYIISPENLIVSGVEDTFNDDDLIESAPDYALKSRAEYSLKVPMEYAKALETVRNSGVVDFTRFANGV